MLHSLVRHKKGLIGVIIVAFITLTAIFAPLLAPYDPQKQNLLVRFRPPVPLERSSSEHLLGTDALGRDLLSRIIYGSRVSLLVGLAAVVISGTLGVTLGLVSGFFGGWIDNIIMRLVDVQLAIPFLVLAIAVIAVLGSSLLNLILVLGISGWVIYCRVARAEVLAIRQQDYVTAIRALGAASPKIMAQHILPNIAPSINVIATLEVGRMILAEAALSFLGLGVPPTVPTWGSIAADGRNYLATAWWVSTLPGVAILITVLGINFLGDWLRDEFDPRLQE